MVDYANPLRPTERIADRDRQDAIASLSHARDEGRLTSDEFDQRSTAARAATTWGDLAPLFSDLPRSAPTGGHAPVDDGYRHSRALGGAWGATIMSFIPFLAFGLFFVFGFALGGWTWSWLFFLLVPVAGVIIYGPGAESRRRRY